MVSRIRRFVRRPFMLLTALFSFGTILLLGGTQLLLAEGSPYFAATGLASLATALLLWHRSPHAGQIYALTLISTIIWALWEVGLDGWALASRLGLPTAIGLWFLMPWVRRETAATGPALPPARLTMAAVVLVTAALASLLVGGDDMADAMTKPGTAKYRDGEGDQTAGAENPLLIPNAGVLPAEEGIWGFTPVDLMLCRIRFRQLQDGEIDQAVKQGRSSSANPLDTICIRPPWTSGAID